jgi:2'-hydroxyisoflavone reductase
MERGRRDFLKLALTGAASLAALSAIGPSAFGGQRGDARRGLRLLILGGTGFLGPHVVVAARARGHVLTLFNRGKTNPGLFPDVEKLHGDRDGDLRALEAREWDAVVDTSGYVPRVVKASADLLAPKVSQYVFISTLSVYDDTRKPGMTEDDPVAQLPPESKDSEDVQAYYGALKALCERAAEASMPGRVTNIRPALIVGPGDPTDRFTYWPVRVAAGGRVLAPGDGDDPVQFIDARDLAAFILTCLERHHFGTYNAPGPAKRLTMAGLLEAVRVGTAGNARFSWVPADFLEKKGVAPWSDLPAWVPLGPDTRGFATISNARAVQRGLRFRPPSETAHDTLAWWQTLPEERRAAPRAGLPRERETATLEAWDKERPGVSRMEPGG